MPSTDTKPELTAKASMAQPVSQPAVYANGLMTLEFSLQIFEKPPNIKFNENLSSGSRVVPCGGRTDMKKLLVAFRYFANTPKKRSLRGNTAVNITCIALANGNKMVNSYGSQKTKKIKKGKCKFVSVFTHFNTTPLTRIREGTYVSTH
jgi:hypothetical protein